MGGAKGIGGNEKLEVIRSGKLGIFLAENQTPPLEQLVRGQVGKDNKKRRSGKRGKAIRIFDRRVKRK